jgi:hypothetical protein
MAERRGRAARYRAAQGGGRTFEDGRQAETQEVACVLRSSWWMASSWNRGNLSLWEGAVCSGSPRLRACCARATAGRVSHMRSIFSYGLRRLTHYSRWEMPIGYDAQPPGDSQTGHMCGMCGRSAGGLAAATPKGVPQARLPGPGASSSPVSTSHVTRRFPESCLVQHTGQGGSGIG